MINKILNHSEQYKNYLLIIAAIAYLASPTWHIKALILLAMFLIGWRGDKQGYKALFNAAYYVFVGCIVFAVLFSEASLNYVEKTVAEDLAELTFALIGMGFIAKSMRTIKLVIHK